MEPEVLNFKSREDYKNYLKKVIDSFGDTEYNIFMHSISNCCINRWNRGPIEEKRDAILKEGLRMSDYGSIAGTMRFICSSKDANLDEIIDYNYDNYEKAVSCIIAIPKYVKIKPNGTEKTIEYSSLDGQEASNGRFCSPELEEEYRRQNFGYLPNGDHIKFCMYDAIKGSSNLPVEYLVGVQEIDKNAGFYSFTSRGTHLSQITPGEVNRHYDNVELKILDLYQKYGTDDSIQIIVKSALDYIKEHIEKSASYDFDFD